MEKHKENLCNKIIKKERSKTISEIKINKENEIEIISLFYKYELLLDKKKNLKILMKVRFSFLLVILILLSLYFALAPLIILIGIWGVIERKKIIKLINDCDENIIVTK